MLTLTDYEAYENNVTNILNAGVNVDTGVPFDVATIDKNLDITPQEHFAFQNCQARSHAAGTISTDVASIIYWALGESLSSTNGGWMPHVTTARKQTITQLMSELLKKEIKGAVT